MRSDRRIALAAVLCFAAVACDAPTVDGEAAGYDPALPGDLIYHWPAGRAIAIYVDPAAGGDALRALLAPAFDVWMDSLHYAEHSLVIASTPERADVIVHTRDAPLLVDTGGCTYPATGAGGITFFCPALSGDTLEVLALRTGGPGRVKMDVAIDPARATSTTTVRALLTHELGHVLGIGAHSNQATDLMFALPTVERPSTRDASTLRWLLHRPADLAP